MCETARLVYCGMPAIPATTDAGPIEFYPTTAPTIHMVLSALIYDTIEMPVVSGRSRSFVKIEDW